MLELEKINTHYGSIQSLWDINLNIRKAEIVTILGSNGAGKSTLLNTISGIIRPTSGTITFEGNRIDTVMPHQIIELGLAQIPEGGRPFLDMSVQENLEMGAYPARAWRSQKDTLKEIYELFPRLKERAGQMARTLSGGEKQMLAIGRGLMSKPVFCMFDEPSYGLAPIIVSEVFQIIKKLRERGITIMLIEQNVKRALEIADRAYVLENGRITLQGPCQELMQSDHIRQAFLGI
ncbi:MAG TPA: ABC transporter ATP-binding protein [Dehalococcoidales bacterium]|nr:ABC transporter ATP-binding protein [Dehalococcoidales bacterium]